MKKQITAIVAIAVVLGGVSLAFAAVTESHKAQAGKLAELVSGRDTVVANFEAMLKPQVDQMAQMGLPPDKVKELQKVFGEFAVSIADDPALKTQMTDIYAEAFTEDEIKQLLEFYNSPIGVKYSKAMPALMAKASTAAQEAAAKHQADFTGKVREIMASGMPAPGAPGAAPAPGGVPMAPAQ